MTQDDVVLPFKVAMRLFRDQLIFALVRNHAMTPEEAAQRVNNAIDGKDTELNDILNQAAAAYFE